jgi:hypothetical protein
MAQPRPAFNIDAAWWSSACAVMEKPWPREAVWMDLRFWASRFALDGTERPGRLSLASRWGWSEGKARDAMRDTLQWWDHSLPLPEVAARSAASSDANEPCAEFDEMEGWTDRATHAAIVARAVVFLRRRVGCKIAVSEACAGSPTGRPDGIGWCSMTMMCHHIEVKVSRSDFRNDRKKVSHLADRVIGDYRWYMTPPGLLTAADIPAGWGLVEAKPRGFRVVVDAPKVTPTDGALQDERSILTGLIRASQYGSILDETTGRLA